MNTADTLAPPLLRHQAEGVEFLLRRRSALLAFEQGLGKTRVAAEAFDRLLASGRMDTLVVICPNSLKQNWAAELRRFTPQLDYVIIQGPPLGRRRVLATTTARVVILNYETARNEILAIRALMSRRRTVLVLDESHYIKNYRSLNSTAAQHLSPLTDYRWLLTGTPVTNTAADLYPQLCIVAGSRLLGSFTLFEVAYGHHGTTPAQRQALAAKVAPYLLRRTKEECLDLPDKTFIDVVVELPSWQRKLYNGLRDDLASEVRGMTRDEFKAFVPTAMTRLLRLSQLASNPALLLSGEGRTPGKFAELDRIIAELVEANSRKVIVWSHYVRTIETLTMRYAVYGAANLYGGTPAADRLALADRFQTDPALRVLVANPAAAGLGFTITAASYAIYETLTWRYDLYAQSQDRNHRIGQRNPVTYIRLIAGGTVEEVIAEALERKTQLAGELVGDFASQSSIAEMTPEGFCRMLRARAIPDSTA